MSLTEPCSLCEMEARKIYAAIFIREIPLLVLDRFVIASKRLNQSVPQTEMDSYYRALKACNDLEALELAARYTRRFPLLGRKFRLMAYLAETLPENQPYFINERSSFLAGMTRSAAGTFRTVFKMMKGLWIVRRAAHA
jgi:hypothetical protein